MHSFAGCLFVMVIDWLIGCFLNYRPWRGRCLWNKSFFACLTSCAIVRLFCDCINVHIWLRLHTCSFLSVRFWSCRWARVCVPVPVALCLSLFPTIFVFLPCCAWAIDLCFCTDTCICAMCSHTHTHTHTRIFLCAVQCTGMRMCIHVVMFTTYVLHPQMGKYSHSCRYPGHARTHKYA